MIRRDDGPTVIDQAPFSLVTETEQDDEVPTLMRRIVPLRTSPRRDSRKEREAAPLPTLSPAAPAPARRESARGNPSTRARSDAAAFEVGGDDAFIFAWGRSNAAARTLGRLLNGAIVLCCVLAGVVGWLAWRNEQKETFVFVRDALGNVVQADASSFLHAGDSRTEVELKGFMRRWVVDAFTWTPLDVEDRLKAALSFVDGKAQTPVKAGLALPQRKELVDAGNSGRVYDDPKAGRVPQVVIVRRSPLEVMVSFDRYVIDSAGAIRDLGPLIVRTLLREVPRTPANPHGLLISDAQISEKL